MKSIVIGTAGHIDHGKTALVKALTGIDADRLEEEKRRGITIDLGFAHMELAAANGEKLRIGFVDVPGHERFVRNMLAGVGGIDLVLLVIAADESIKPQTREHFDILKLIGVRHGITVLTKADAVDADTLDVVRLEVEEFLRGSFLEAPGSPIIAVSSLTGTGLEDLKQAIADAAASTEARDSDALARLPIDRVFSMKGFGTVVTGTLISGVILKNDELEVFPDGQRVRIRGLQVHGETADRAVAGQRTAVNLAGVAIEELSRGMTLAPVSALSTTRRLDVQLQLLASAPRPLKSRARVHFHSHTMQTVAELRFSGDSKLEPGEKGFARVVLPEPALLLPGDRFIIRQFSPVVTISGGVVLDAAPITRSLNVDDTLVAFASGDIAAGLQARIARRNRHGISLAGLVAETGLSARQVEEKLLGTIKSGGIARIGGLFVEARALDEVRQFLITALSGFHEANPLSIGINKEELRNKTELEESVFEGILTELSRAQKVEVSGDVVRLPGHRVVMKDDEAESRSRIEEAFSAAGLKVPALPEVLAGLKVDKVRAQKIVTLLLREKVLTKISDDLVFHRAALQQLRGLVAERKKLSPRMDVAQFKELTGVSRKYAIPLLEYLDRERVTRRVGDAREIL